MIVVSIREQRDPSQPDRYKLNGSDGIQDNSKLRLVVLYSAADFMKFSRFRTLEGLDTLKFLISSASFFFLLH